jgi:hypothetical protein
MAYPRGPIELTIPAPEIDNGYARAPHGGAVLDGQDRAFPWGRDAMAIAHPSLAAQIRQHIEAQYPYAACDDCLGVLLMAPLDEVREAALVVAKEERFMRRMRFCCTCRRTVELTSRD